MEISGVQIVEDDYGMTKRILPHTFFSLDPSEQKKYDFFRKEHAKVKAIGKPIYDEEVAAKAKVAEEIFLEVVKPYIEGQGLSIEGSFSTYGEPRRTIVKFSQYNLFEKDSPININISLEPSYWFLTQDENLSCNSSISYHPRGIKSHILCDFIKRATENVQEDGIKFPMLFFIGDGLYFASTDFTMPLLGFTKKIVEDISKEDFDELTTLQTECRSYSNDSLKQRVFKEAYENKLEQVLIRTGIKKGIPLEEKIHLN